MPSTVALLIGGEARTGNSTFKRHDPVTGALASEAAAATVADAIAAADAAEAAFPAWSARGPNERRAMLNRVALALEARAGDFVQATELHGSRSRRGPVISPSDAAMRPHRGVPRRSVVMDFRKTT